MDPWGGKSVDAVSDNNLLGFDDDFSEVTAAAPSKRGDSDFSTFMVDSLPPSSSSPLPKISPINFIPRLRNDGDSALSSPLPSNLLPALPPLKDPLTQMMTSEEYISRLEAKLGRIKGGGGGGGQGGGEKRRGKKGFSSAGRQMIDALSSIKESNVLLSTDGSDGNSDSSRININPHFLMQRAFPERTPLTQEELEWLVKHDQLQGSDEIDVDQTSSAPSQ